MNEQLTKEMVAVDEAGNMNRGRTMLARSL